MTSSELAARLGVSGMTIRNWSEQFAGHLSPSASPEGQGRRYFTPEDCAIMETVAALRQRQMGYEAIGEELAAGRREKLETEEAHSEQDGGTGTGLTVQRMTALIGQQQGTIEQLTEERNFLREELASERQARIEAEKLASRAQGMMEGFQQAQQQQTPSEPVQQPPVESAPPNVGPSQTEPPKPKSWLDRVLGR